MNSLLSIGQFAKLCNTSKDTLIHYDEIGLLHPVRIGENHYRLYSVSQCQIFHIIRLLTEQNVALPDIKAIIDDNPAGNILQYLNKTHEELARQKQYVEGAILHLEDLLQLHTHVSPNLTNEPVIVNQAYPQNFFVTMLPESPLRDKEIYQALSEHLTLCSEKGIYPFPITYILKKESLTTRNYTPYMFATPDYSARIDSRIYRKPEISYVIISHSGSFQTIHCAVEKALEYINHKHLRIMGNFYITDFSNHVPSEHSTIYIIQIAVKEF